MAKKSIKRIFSTAVQGWDDAYCQKEFKAHRKKWGKTISNIFDDNWTDKNEQKWIKLENITKKQLAEDEANKGLYTTHKSYYSKAKNAKEERQADKEYFDIVKKQGKEIQKDLNKGFGLIAKNIMRWSD